MYSKIQEVLNSISHNEIMQSIPPLQDIYLEIF